MTEPELYTPTKLELDMIKALFSQIDELGEYYISSVDLMFDDYSTLMFSIVTPTDFDTAGDHMTALHTVAQDVSDEYDRNVVITTVGGEKGGRKVLFNLDEFHTDNVVELNPNKELRRAASAAYPKRNTNEKIPPADILLDVCLEAKGHLQMGFTEDSLKLLTKLSSLVPALIADKRISWPDRRLQDLCNAILELFVAHEKTDAAEQFIDKACTDSKTKTELKAFLEKTAKFRANQKEITRVQTDATIKTIDEIIGE